IGHVPDISSRPPMRQMFLDRALGDPSKRSRASLIRLKVWGNQANPCLISICSRPIIAAVLSPWVGYHSEKFGRKPLLLIGFGIEIVRALLFALYTTYPFLIVAQCLAGISSACVTVLTLLMITDMTTGTGRFNLVQGFVGTVIAIAAAISTGT